MWTSTKQQQKKPSKGNRWNIWGVRTIKMSYRGMWSDSNACDQPPLAAVAEAAPALSRQPSIYSLTFDEFQSTIGGIGKDFGSMNMDELLKSLWTAEESRAMAVTVGALADDVGALKRQGSLSLPRTLSQKTVDEVWRDVVIDNGGSAVGSDFQMQSTIGEMTLEEFLVRAGVVREESNPNVSKPVANKCSDKNLGVYYGDLSASGNSNSAFAYSFPQAPNFLPGSSGTNLALSVAGTRPNPTQLPLVASVDTGRQQRMRGGVVGIVDPASNSGLISGMIGLETQPVASAVSRSLAKHLTFDRAAKVNGDLSSLPCSFNGAVRGRRSVDAVEKVVERRQRRMIKNRESAARSRARKQAYTMELEAELATLKEENQDLEKKHVEALKMQKRQILELLNHKLGPKRSCLRRTHTGPW